MSLQRYEKERAATSENMIFKFDFVPVADQASILEAAAGLKNGNYSYFTPMGYVGKCSNQAGIVVILYYISFRIIDQIFQHFCRFS